MNMGLKLTHQTKILLTQTTQNGIYITHSTSTKDSRVNYTNTHWGLSFFHKNILDLEHYTNTPWRFNSLSLPSLKDEITLVLNYLKNNNFYR